MMLDGSAEIKVPIGLALGSADAGEIGSAATTLGQRGKRVSQPSRIVFDFWACQRPLTRTWGSGQVFDRLCETFGKPDVAFGKTDGIPNGVFSVDKKNGYEWASLPFADNQFTFGYWDPPYDKLYKREGQEIWRCCQRLAILHTYIWPRAWLKRAKREGMVAITMGPMKQIRCLQVFRKKEGVQGTL